ncbi:MAG TPA: trypsin-like peptidase domain-containing protein [Kofleriaceae bacterium]|nr:trypsin-like peptidase domain-containing protein [Kofleriaceae bacterium]
MAERPRRADPAAAVALLGLVALLGMLAAIAPAGCAGPQTESAAARPPRTAAPSPRPAPDAALTPAQIARRATPAVVQIRAPGRVGSGFVVGADGLIATSLHVVEDADQIAVVLADGRTFERVRVVAFDQAQDVVVLAIDADGLPALALARHPVEAGERVVAIGHPHGLANTVSDGLVSALRVDATGGEGLQISAPISPGSSGGPILNDRGQVVGVTTSTDRIGQNLNFATPARHLVPLLRSRARLPISALPSRFAARLFAGCGAAELVAVYRGLGTARVRRVRRSADATERAIMDLVLELDSCPGVSRMLLFALEEAAARPRRSERLAVLVIVLAQIDEALRHMMRSP